MNAEAHPQNRRKSRASEHLLLSTLSRSRGPTFSLCGFVLGTIFFVLVVSGLGCAPPASQQQSDEGSIPGLRKELGAEGQLQAAVKKAEADLGTAERRFGPDAAETGFAVNTIGMLYKASGQYEKAKPLLERALAICEKSYGADHPNTAISYNNLALLLKTQGDYAAAEPLYRKSLAIAERVSGPAHQDTVVSLVNLAMLYDAQGRYDEARMLLQRALSACEKTVGHEHGTTAACLINLALVAQHKAAYVEAESLLLRAQKALTPVLGKDHSTIAGIDSQLATLYDAQGQYERAGALHEKVLEIRGQIFGNSHPSVAQALNNLASNYKARGLNEQAFDMYVRAIAIREKAFGQHHPELAVSLNNLAGFLLKTGDKANSRRLYEQSLAILDTQVGPYQAQAISVLMNLASLSYYADRDYAKAERLYEKAAQLCEETLGPDHPLLSTALPSLASVRVALGDPADADELFDRARRIARRHVAGVVPSLTIDEQIQFIRVRDADEFHRALTFAIAHPANGELAERSAGWVANGKAVAQEATGLREKLTRASARDKRHESLSQLQRIRAELADLSYRSEATKDTAESSAKRRSLREEERRLVHEIGGRLALLSREDPWVGQDEVRSGIAARSALIDIIRFKVFDFAMQSQDKAWQSERYAAWVVPPPGKGSTQVVDLGDASTIDLAVASYREAVRAAIGGGGVIAAAGELQAEDALRETAVALSERVLWPILEGIQAAGCDEELDELLISPDGELWLVPWAALPLSDGRYVVEQYSVNTLTSARDLVHKQEAQSRVNPPLIFADPLFELSKEALAKAVSEADGSRNADAEDMATNGGAAMRSASEIGRVSRLPGTLNEARRVASSLERLTRQKPLTFLQARAIEERVKQAGSPEVLHFATHGFALPDQHVSAGRFQLKLPANLGGRPGQGHEATIEGRLEDPLLRCGILLTGCNLVEADRPQGVEDGCLTGKEIVGLELRGTGLVVLSACDTGTGRIQYGEGVAGLRQAFLLAGADAVLATLWQVPDAPTADLVAGFFDHLAAGKSKASALRLAQLDLIEKRRKANGAAHPAVWAAFELTGR